MMTTLWQLLVLVCSGAGGYVATGFHQLLILPPLIVGVVLGAWLGLRLRDRTPDAPL